MGKLSTHVLDTMHGGPAQGVKIELYAVGDSRKLLKTDTTNVDGRCDAPLLGSDEIQPGVYELVFHAGDYFATKGVAMPNPRFIDQVVIRFGIANPNENYHVPLVATPWTYSTYRGS
jgi:5-hydroxyisourate hydrolase